MPNLTRAALASLLPGDRYTDRFLKKIDEAPPPIDGIGPCLMWNGATTKGYGQFRGEQGRLVPAHQWLWVKLNGPVPEGDELHHRCHEIANDLGLCTGGYTCPHRACVSHVEPTTHRDNMLRGNTFAAAEAARDYCSGEFGPHDLRDPANVYRPPGRENERHCRACGQARARKHRRKAKRRSGQLTLIEP